MLSERIKNKLKTMNYTRAYETFYAYNKDNPENQLNLNEITILNLLISYEINGQKLHLNYEQLGIRICKNERTAKSTIKSLKEKGLIDWKAGNSYTRFANVYCSTKKLQSLIVKYADFIFDEEPNSKED